MELLETFDSLGNKKNVGKEKAQARINGDFLSVIHLWIINPANKKILIQQRSFYKESAKGKWDLSVGGHIRFGESEIQALIRETSEEIGITLTEKDDIRKLFSAKYDNNYYKYFWHVYLLVKDIRLEDIVINEEEVMDIKYITIEEFKDMYYGNNNELQKHDYIPDLINKMQEILS
ncbi:MAG: NUDIX domain-containing protein [Clostridia bacterium]